MASVSAGGPFSIFPGVDRVLWVLEGELSLAFDGGAVLKLTPESEPAVFPGRRPRPRRNSRPRPLSTSTS